MDFVQSILYLLDDSECSNVDIWKSWNEIFMYKLGWARYYLGI